MALVETEGTATQEAAPEIEYEFVKMPDGKVVAVPKDQIHDAPADTEKDEAPVRAEKPAEPEHYYVHLANGEILRVAEPDLPVTAGTNAPYGYWHRSGKVHHVTGVFPVERNMERK